MTTGRQAPAAGIAESAADGTDMVVLAGPSLAVACRRERVRPDPPTRRWKNRRRADQPTGAGPVGCSRGHPVGGRGDRGAAAGVIRGEDLQHRAGQAPGRAGRGLRPSGRPLRSRRRAGPRRPWRNSWQRWASARGDVGPLRAARSLEHLGLLNVRHGWSWSNSTTAPGTPAYKRISTVQRGVSIVAWSTVASPH